LYSQSFLQLPKEKGLIIQLPKEKELTMQLPKEKRLTVLFLLAIV
jgi:hypothetical protein